MEFSEIIRIKSPEQFDPAPLSREDLQAVAEAGDYAPVFGTLRFTVVDDRALLDQVNEASLAAMRASGNEFAEKMANTPGYDATRRAAAFVVIAAQGGDDAMGFNLASASCAAQNMLLEAASRGIAGRFMMGPVMALSQPQIAARLALPEGYAPLVAVGLGRYPGEPRERVRATDNITFA